MSIDLMLMFFSINQFENIIIILKRERFSHVTRQKLELTVILHLNLKMDSFRKLRCHMNTTYCTWNFMFLKISRYFSWFMQAVHIVILVFSFLFIVWTQKDQKQVKRTFRKQSTHQKRAPVALVIGVFLPHSETVTVRFQFIPQTVRPFRAEFACSLFPLCFAFSLALKTRTKSSSLGLTKAFSKCKCQVKIKLGGSLAACNAWHWWNPTAKP